MDRIACSILSPLYKQHMHPSPQHATLPRLPLKPSDNSAILYSTGLSCGTLSIRSLQPADDLETIFGWVNQPYARRFWQMDGPAEELRNTCLAVLASPHAHSFMVLLDGRPVAQVDLYQVLADELGNHIAAGPFDCGLHLLMLPPRQSFPGLSRLLLRAFVAFYFSSPSVTDLYAEPDIENILAGRLAVRAGFRRIGRLELPGKLAGLYRITRSEYLNIIDQPFNSFYDTDQIP